MFGFGWTEILVLLVVGLFVFGPERLPSVVAEVARTIRHLRQSAAGISDDLREQLGPEFAELRLPALRPQEFVRRHLLDEVGFDGTSPGPTAGAAPLTAGPTGGTGGAAVIGGGMGRVLTAGEIPPFDLDAT